ncbi:uncharacterized protein LOC135206690 [Macrobrachium nipponense]|uniref:uncharacterized protein LOC135206690 n=1 Tax=Macrobrachium nipponense TaxID=159736 RepID=UPI0030C8AE99
MMKLVVLAMALTAVSAGTVFTGLPLTHGALTYSGLPLATSGLPLATSGLPLATSHFGAPISQVVPTTYLAGAAPALVQPAPYQIHTGVRAEVAVEPVEQHGYVIKY